MKLGEKPIRKRSVPLSEAKFMQKNLLVCGKMPDLIKALIVDVDGTLFPLDHPFFKARRLAQYRWLCQRLGLSMSDLVKRVACEKQKLSAGGNGKRVCFSRIVYSLDPTIKCAEWQEAMTKSVSVHDFNSRLRQNDELEEAISCLTADRCEGVKIIFATNASAGTANIALKMLFGARQFNHGMFGVVGHDQMISKPDPAFFTQLVGPALRQKGVPLKHAISIGDRLGDDGYAAVKAGVPAAVIVDGPNDLVAVLREIHRLRQGV